MAEEEEDGYEDGEDGEREESPWGADHYVISGCCQPVVSIDVRVERYASTRQGKRV